MRLDGIILRITCLRLPKNMKNSVATMLFGGYANGIIHNL